MSTKNKIAIVIPCYNESYIIIDFLNLLQEKLDKNHSFTVIVIDDYSIDNTSELLSNYEFTKENIKLHVMNLPYNRGHQGAIQQGLFYANQFNPDNVIIMDGDGEDDPAAIIELLKMKDNDYVPVARSKRKESYLFRVMYIIYKILFKIIIGREMNFGNYCMINNRMLTNVSENRFIHLAGFLSKQRCKKGTLYWDRKKRLDGTSKMSFSNLIMHGFKAFVEYSEDFLMVFLKLSMLISSILVTLICNVFYKKLISHEAIPGWASNLSVTLFIGAILCFGFFSIGLLLLSLSYKNKRYVNF